jgi:hypothetical protein
MAAVLPHKMTLLKFQEPNSVKERGKWQTHPVIDFDETKEWKILAR